MATVISYGGGVQSTALVVLAMRERWPIDEIVHVDLVDAESPATREYVARFREWLRQEHGRDITVIERNMYRDMLVYSCAVAWQIREVYSFQAVHSAVQGRSSAALPVRPVPGWAH